MHVRCVASAFCWNLRKCEEICGRCKMLRLDVPQFSRQPLVTQSEHNNCTTVEKRHFRVCKMIKRSVLYHQCLTLPALSRVLFIPSAPSSKFGKVPFFSDFQKSAFFACMKHSAVHHFISQVSSVNLHSL